MELDARALQHYFKALADENRLRMLGLMADQERSVQELADLLGVSAPTISHHVSKLRAIGLLNLRQAGNQRFYRLNQEALSQFKTAVATLETLAPTLPQESSGDWIEALPIEEWEKKVLRDYTFAGRLRQIPSKEKKFLAILNWLASRFEAQRIYTEREVNEVLKQYHADYATLRRGLIAYGFLRRKRGGSEYWVTPEDEAPITADEGLLGERLREAGISRRLRG